MKKITFVTNQKGKNIEAYMPENWAEVNWGVYKLLVTTPNLSTKQAISILLNIPEKTIDNLTNIVDFIQIEMLLENLFTKQGLDAYTLPSKYKETELFMDASKTPLGLYIDLTSDLKELQNVETELVDSVVKKLYYYSIAKEYDFEKASKQDIQHLPAFLVMKWAGFFLRALKKLKTQNPKRFWLFKYLTQMLKSKRATNS